MIFCILNSFRVFIAGYWEGKINHSVIDTYCNSFVYLQHKRSIISILLLLLPYVHAPVCFTMPYPATTLAAWSALYARTVKTMRPATKIAKFLRLVLAKFWESVGVIYLYFRTKVPILVLCDMYHILYVTTDSQRFSGGYTSLPMSKTSQLF